MLPFQFLVAALSGWLHREQADLIAFLREENRILVGGEAPAFRRSRTAAPGGTGPSPRAAPTRASCDDRDAGYDSALAPSVGSPQMDLCPARTAVVVVYRPSCERS